MQLTSSEPFKDTIRFLKTLRKSVRRQRFSTDGVNAKGNIKQLLCLKQKAHILNANDAIIKKKEGTRAWRRLPFKAKLKIMEDNKQREITHGSLQQRLERKRQRIEKREAHQKSWRVKAGKNQAGISGEKARQEITLLKGKYIAKGDVKFSISA